MSLLAVILFLVSSGAGAWAEDGYIISVSQSSDLIGGEPTAPCKKSENDLADWPAAARCPEGSDGLRRFRVIVLSTANVNTIPDGVLYTSRFTVKAPSGAAILQNLNVGSSDPGGTTVMTDGYDGQVVIGGQTPTEQPPTETPTPTDTPVPSTGTPTTPTLARTSTRTPTCPCLPTATIDGGGGGCNISSSASPSSWHLFGPLVVLLWLRHWHGRSRSLRSADAHSAQFWPGRRSGFPRSVRHPGRRMRSCSTRSAT